MKKYDILLLGLYAIIIAVSCGFVRYANYKQQQIQMVFQQVISNQDITKVVISNIKSPLEVFYAKEDDSDTWCINGSVNQNHFESLYIKDGVLHIENIDEAWRLSTLKVSRDVVLEIVNSPKVKILSDEELSKRLKNKKTKLKYEL